MDEKTEDPLTEDALHADAMPEVEQVAALSEFAMELAYALMFDAGSLMRSVGLDLSFFIAPSATASNSANNTQ